MVQHVANKTISKEARLVLSEGQKIWEKFFKVTDTKKVIHELFLNKSDVGWYQIRRALMLRNANNEGVPTSFSALDIAHKALAAKLLPFVYEYEFLPRPNKT